MKIGMAVASVVLGVVLVSMPRSAAAEDTVVIDGQTYWCTNSCVVTHHSNGSWTLTDCCGGRVGTRIEP